MTTTIRVPGATFTEREHTLPLDHAASAGRPSRSSPARSRVPTAVAEPYLVFLQGGPGIEATRPTSPPTRLDGARARRLPRPAARPARHRPVDAGRADIPGDTPEAQADVPDPLPRRFDRARRGGHPARARDRSLERARPELRRVHLDDLPVVRARGPARGVHHRRAGADRPVGRRHLRGHVRPRHRARTSATTRAIPEDRARVREIHRRLDAEPYLLAPRASG